MTLEQVPCNLCGTDDTRTLYTKPDTRLWLSDQVFRVVQCRSCGLGYVNPRPTVDAISVWYPTVFFGRRDLDTQSPRYARQAAYVMPRGTGRLLDVGCAGGEFVEYMRARGWSADGIDPFGPPRYRGDLLRAVYRRDPYTPQSFDVVTAWGVCEHLHDPMAHFRAVARLLRPGGRFIALTTNLRSPWSRWSFAEDVPRHLYFFSPATMRRYAEAVGLRVIRVDHDAGIMTPDTTDLFRVRLLRALGVSWPDVYDRTRHPAWLRAAELVARAAGKALFAGGWLEARLRVSGVIVTTMEPA